MARKRRSALSTVVSFMSDEAREQLEDANRANAATTLPLEGLRPDPAQPRRLLPPDLQSKLDQGQLGPHEALRQWLERNDKGGTSAGQILPALHTLAQSIAQHGLINPISVRRLNTQETAAQGVEYLIVTGERRYWAHVLLALQGQVIQEGQHTADPNQIKVTLTAEGVSIRAHQLIENIVREDINAAEKAHGMWALRLELSGVNHGSPATLTLEEMQALEQRGVLISWSAIEEALGISKRYRIYVISVLQLTPQAQELVQVNNLSERLIRPIVQKLRDYPSLQHIALEQLVAWQQSEETPAGGMNSSVKQLVNRLLRDANSAAGLAAGSATRAVAPPPTLRALHRRVQGMLSLVEDLDEAQQHALGSLPPDAELVQALVELQNRLAAITGPLREDKA